MASKTLTCCGPQSCSLGRGTWEEELQRPSALAFRYPYHLAFVHRSRSPSRSPPIWPWSWSSASTILPLSLPLSFLLLSSWKLIMAELLPLKSQFLHVPVSSFLHILIRLLILKIFSSVLPKQSSTVRFALKSKHDNKTLRMRILRVSKFKISNTNY